MEVQDAEHLDTAAYISRIPHQSLIGVFPHAFYYII